MKPKIEKILNMLSLENKRIIKKEIKKIEQKYKALTDNLNVGIYRNTGPSYKGKAKFIFANPAIIKIFGYSNIEEFLSISVSDLYQNPEDRKRFSEKIIREGEVRDEELLLKKKDGKPITCSVTSVAVKDKEGNAKYYDGIITNISGRIKAEEILKGSLDRTEKILQATVKSLASAVEQRDPYTAGHQTKVTQLSEAIAKEIKMPDSRNLNLAASVHDVGKIYVPAEILSRPTKLSKVEFALIKEHPRAGYDILKTIPFQGPVAEIVLQHHERLNGSGYPKKLNNGKILLESKILMVADVVEAMSSHRPYRPAKTMTETLEEISKNKGILYDSKVVDACLRVFKKGFEYNKNL